MITQKEFLKLRDFIYKKTGIFMEEKKYPIIGKKIDKLMRDRGFDDFRSLFHSLRFSKDDKLFQDIISLITVNETYFFREKYQFDSLINYVLPEIHKKRPPSEVIRILCAPSSTGEEPYSIAIELLEEGRIVEERDIEIVGIDIDSNVIEKAKKGYFTKRSVQFVPPMLLRKYFKQEGSLYKIDEFLTEVVDFRVVNVVDTLQFGRLGKFDIIFSRNMLIYFDDASRQKTAMNFYNSLKPGGYVFLGHAESMSRITSVFKTIKVGESIVYKKE